MYRLQSLAVFAIIAAGIGGATPAQANNMVVGNAILIQQDVEGAFNDQDWAQTSKGDDVFEAEFIRTQVNSRANFALLDGSTIGLGATAIMKIDHVVFDPHNRSIQKLIVSAKDGAVRWISGNSMSGAYQIDTPHAVITDEGTAFDLVVEPQRTLVLLHTGRVTVCAKGAPGRCKTLSRRGEMVLATTDDVVGPWESGLEPSGFETQCLNAKCTIAAFALPPPQPPSDGDRKAPERPPEPHHAVAPSRSDTREAVTPSRPEKRDATTPSGPQIREVVAPSGPQIHEVDVPRPSGHLWLYAPAVPPRQPPHGGGGGYGGGQPPHGGGGGYGGGQPPHGGGGGGYGGGQPPHGGGGGYGGGVHNLPPIGGGGGGLRLPPIGGGGGGLRLPPIGGGGGGLRLPLIGGIGGGRLRLPLGGIGGGGPRIQ
jgi:hypothetical protein